MITEKDYALGLLRATRNKEKNEIAPLIDNFVSLLVKNNNLSKVPNILNMFSVQWNRENGIKEAEIITARSSDRLAVDQARVFLQGLPGAEKVTIVEKIDEGILGGIIIKYEDKVIDKSMRRKIKNLNNAIKE